MVNKRFLSAALSKKEEMGVGGKVKKKIQSNSAFSFREVPRTIWGKILGSLQQQQTVAMLLPGKKCGRT